MIGFYVIITFFFFFLKSRLELLFFGIIPIKSHIQGENIDYVVTNYFPAIFSSCKKAIKNKQNESHEIFHTRPKKKWQKLKWLIIWQRFNLFESPFQFALSSPFPSVHCDCVSVCCVFLIVGSYFGHLCDMSYTVISSFACVANVLLLLR